ncbi:ArsR/SmtB family transcription factor [Gordonia phosphorivorans]|uniref:ArsR/SmtB family transcription factor n=1 Tax=Gordonia phosphorivorans TaxID=1056982 RepID=A0ABV6H7L6_9ACTN
MQVQDVQVDPVPWADRFAVLADPTRLALLIAMHNHPGLAVLSLAELAGVSPNAASQALRTLRAQEWVHAERAGRTVRYSLNSDAIVHRILHDIIGCHHRPHVTAQR